MTSRRLDHLLREDIAKDPTGASVRAVYVQAALAGLGYALSVDDKRGPETKRTLTRFQKDRGLPTTGIAAAATVTALAAHVSAGLAQLSVRVGTRFESASIAVLGDSQAEGLKLAFPKTVTVLDNRGKRTEQLIARLFAEATFPAKRTLLIVHGGGNDLPQRHDATRIAVQLQAIALLAARRSAGLRVVIGTIPPRGPTFDSLGAEGRRQEDVYTAVNEWILSSDNPMTGFNSAAVLGQPTEFRSPRAAFRGPTTHFNAAGYKALAAAYSDAFGVKPPAPVAPAPPPAAPVAPRWLRESPELISTPLAPKAPLTAGITGANRALADTYNRVGGLIERACTLLKLPVAAALGVWIKESSGRAPTPGQVLTRFENHVFFSRWAKGDAAREAIYDTHFRHGGRAGVVAKLHREHRFRETAGGAWLSHHGDQALEARALALASRLANAELAHICASFGSAQVMGFNHKACGYASAVAMADEFKKDERWHVLAFFDFVRSNSLLDELQTQNWAAFAKAYNGSASYGDGLGKLVALAEALLRSRSS